MKQNKKLSKLAEDIINMEFKNTDTLDKVEKKFFNIVRKHGVRQGTRTKNGRTCNNFEWTMCKTLFVAKISSYFEMKDFFEKIPKDLECY